MPPTKPIDLNQVGLPMPARPAIVPSVAAQPPLPPGYPFPAAAPPPATQPPPPLPTEPAPIELCHHCGANPKSDPEKIGSDDLIAFAQSVWRNEPFIKAYTLFGGAVQVVFRTLSTDQAQSAQRAVLAQASRNEVPGGVLAMLAVNDLAEEHQFALAVGSLSVADKMYTPGPAEQNDSTAAIAAIRLIAGNHIAYQAIRKMYIKFFVLGRRLVDVGSNPSFWEATLPSGQSPDSPTTATKA